MSAQAEDLRGIPAVPEGGLDDSLVARLPDHVPPAPWESTVDAVFWWHRSTEAAEGVLPDPLEARAWLPLTIGGMLTYREGPVGPYGELFGVPRMVKGGPMLGHVPFMAVDSEVSLVGGRRNWAFPKTMAEFGGELGLPGRVSAAGEGWAMTVTGGARPRRLPGWVRLSCAQVRPDGRVATGDIEMRGWARVGSVRVKHDRASSLSSWLVDGRHPAVFLSGTQTANAPR